MTATLDWLTDAAVRSAAAAWWVTAALSVVLFGVAVINVLRSGFPVENLREPKVLLACAVLVGASLYSVIADGAAFRRQGLVELAFAAGISAAALTWPRSQGEG